MAAIRKRGNTWQYTVDLGRDELTGKRKQFSKGGFKTEREAKSAARKIELEIENGKFITVADTSFQGVFEEYIENFKKKGNKESTVDIRSNTAKHLINVWGPYPISKITKKMYQDHLYSLSEKVSRGTLELIHVVGRQIFSYAIEMEMIKTNPTLGFSLPKEQLSIEDLEDDGPITFMEKEELARFLKVASVKGKYLDYEIFTTLAYTGIRSGELMALKWADFNAQEATLRITKTLFTKGGNRDSYQVWTPKTYKSARTVTISKKLVELLEMHRIEQEQIKEKNHRIYVDESFIFADTDGRPFNRLILWRNFQRLLNLANIEKQLTVHSMRHTHASLSIEAGVDWQALQNRLGHESVRTTMDKYVHLTKGLEKESSRKFEELMDSVLPIQLDHEVPLNTKEIGSKLNISQPTLRQYCSALEAGGWVFERDEEGRRLFTKKDFAVLKQLKEKRKRSVHIEDTVNAILLPVETNERIMQILHLQEYIQKTSRKIEDGKVKIQGIDQLNDLLMQVNRQIEEIAAGL